MLCEISVTTVYHSHKIDCDLMINQLADQISGTGELGLGRQLAQEMQQRKPVTDESTLESSARSRRVH